tara:strand:- start:370 stop:588 length:219 start_codon:yes stop_codon:yes gene_type:complete
MNMKYQIVYQFQPYKAYRQAGVYDGKKISREIEAENAKLAEHKLRLSVPKFWNIGGNEIGINEILEIKEVEG